MTTAERTFKVWLDSGANAESCRETFVTLSALGCTPAEWDAMTEENRDELMREIAFERSDWGYSEEEGK